MNIYIGLEELKALSILIAVTFIATLYTKQIIRRILLVIVIIIVPIASNIYLASVYQNNLQYFYSGQSLYCVNKHSRLIIQKDKEWDVSKDYFNKDDLLLRVVDCKEYE